MVDSLGCGKRDLVGGTLTERPSSDDGNILGVESNIQVPSVSSGCIGLEDRPRSLPISSVDIQVGIAAGAGYDRPIDTSDRGPDMGRRAGRLISSGGLQRYTSDAAKGQGVAADLVVDGELVAAKSRTAAVLVGHHVLSVTNLSDDRHPRSSSIHRVSDVVDNSAPGLATVRGDLVNHLLAVSGISLWH
jgi:hypothetical protein